MTRIATALMAALLVIGSVSAFPLATAAQSGPSVASTVGDATYAQVDGNASANATAPGERLSAVVGVGQAEFEGEIELRAYGIEYALAATNDSKAEVVKARLEAAQARLADLEAKKAALEEARGNGSIGQGEYNARVTALAASTQTVKQVANASEARAGALPADVLDNHGVNVTAIQRLKQHAEGLTGPEVAAIARSIAGPNVGQAIGRGPPEDIGARTDASPGDRGDDGQAASDARAAIDRADRQVAAAEERLALAERRVGDDASANATGALEQARAELEAARQAIEAAREARDAGKADEAVTLAEEAIDHAEASLERAQVAIEAVQQGDSGDGPGGDGQTGGGDY